MTQVTKNTMKELNIKYFNSHINEIVWSVERHSLSVKMDTGEIYSFEGDEAKEIYKLFNKQD